METATDGLTQAQRETLFVWTVMTSNQRLIDTAGIDAETMLYLLQPLTIDATDLIGSFYEDDGKTPLFADLREIFRKTAIDTAASAPPPDSSNVAASGEDGWQGDGDHPLISELRDAFDL